MAVQVQTKVAPEQTAAATEAETEEVDDTDTETTEAETETATETDENLDATPAEDKVADAAETPEIVAPAKWEPTVQQRNLGGAFEGIDMRLYNVQCVKQTGKPTVSQRAIVKKVKETVKVKAEDGTETEQEIVKDVPDTVKDITYNWSDEKELIGDPFPSLTAALRAQKAFAMELKDEGYSVKEYLSKEYGVWYATEDTGTKDGFRFSIMPVTAPAKPVKVVKVKAPKEPKVKAAKADKAVKVAKDGAKAKNSQTAAAEAAVAASDPVSVEIEE